MYFANWNKKLFLIICHSYFELYLQVSGTRDVIVKKEDQRQQKQDWISLNGCLPNNANKSFDFIHFVNLLETFTPMSQFCRAAQLGHWGHMYKNIRNAIHAQYWFIGLFYKPNFIRADSWKQILGNSELVCDSLLDIICTIICLKWFLVWDVTKME